MPPNSIPVHKNVFLSIGHFRAPTRIEYRSRKTLVILFQNFLDYHIYDVCVIRAFPSTKMTALASDVLTNKVAITFLQMLNGF